MNVAASTQNQAFSALLFLYQEVLKKRLPWIDDIVRASRPEKVPFVFTQEEARQVLSRMTGTPRLMAHPQQARDWCEESAGLTPVSSNLGRAFLQAPRRAARSARGTG